VNTPAPSYTSAAVDALTEAVEQEHDFGGWLSLVLVRVAARKGSLNVLTDGRPGSWEAALVDRLARGLAFDDTGLAPYAEGDGGNDTGPG
jgi:hypothetical protein